MEQNVVEFNLQGLITEMNAGEHTGFYDTLGRRLYIGLTLSF
jgi:hypothetical protein